MGGQHAGANFLAHDGHFAGRFNANPNDTGPDTHHGHLNLVADLNPLSGAA
jgi:hypothetical protein